MDSNFIKRSLFSLLVMLATSILTINAQNTPQTATRRTPTVNWLGIGWNCGNQLDAFNDEVSGETLWGNPPATEQLFAAVRKAGFTSVRIPVTWLGHVGPAPEYKIDKKWMNLVARYVANARKADLNVIINMHHDGSNGEHWLDIWGAANNSELNEEIKARISAMWTQIAQYFIDEDEHLIFESFNEIHDGQWGWGGNLTDEGRQYAALNDWNQAFVDAVRAVGGMNKKRWLAVPAYCTNIDIAIQSFKMPVDKVHDRLMLSLHCYDPYEYTLEAKVRQWGKNAAEWLCLPDQNEDALFNQLQKITTNFINKGIPTYIGEFGCVHRDNSDDEQFRQYYLKFYTASCRRLGIAPFYWDNGASGTGREQSGLFNRTTGQPLYEGAENIMKAMTE